jgi:hypothetical protein
VSVETLRTDPGARLLPRGGFGSQLFKRVTARQNVAPKRLSSFRRITVRELTGDIKQKLGNTILASY